jgi:hypothetical protein
MFFSQSQNASDTSKQIEKTSSGFQQQQQQQQQQKQQLQKDDFLWNIPTRER